jgi:hypothetical protein
MIDGAALRDFYIDAWRRIPELVAAVGEEESNIRASNGISRVAHSLQREILDMPEGSIFVAYQGFTRGAVRNAEITKHEIAAFIRAASPDDDSHIAFGALLIDGIPNGEEQPVRYLEMNEFVDSMDMPRFERVSTSDLTFDIWKLTFTVPEHA